VSVELNHLEYSVIRLVDILLIEQDEK